ncbi:DNA-binding LacI/PurR family transcriptional regulator [Phyllobacterium ifriqiyense]|uniref:DNA-binding LacI/PurR family transcriptional regulator n=1 Tax=Phyllobacterium ifriqiyense TaxID=314238 RepID=A0ABU0S7K3_9HYPH|nr:substrate-binding domain-containing protein [Phyllobacterium ifriqiyense]MDQ0996486.1 DNA-binding LacI/PurR family transcriptional regulator [Phyllobacterium ifriqiyense]
MSKSFVSANDVARHAGVSRSAVSRAFTPGASVSEDTRKRVMNSAQTLGYHVNQLARGLMRSESGIVCLVVSEMDTPYRARLVRAFSHELQKAGKISMLINTDRSDGGVDAALRQTLNYRADASILLSGLPDKAITKLCLDSGQRIVLINRDDNINGPFHINLNDHQAAKVAVNAFLRAGCRALAFVNSEVGTPSLMARENGFLAAAASFGLNVTVTSHGNTVYESGRHAAHSLLTSFDRPDAVFCVNDLMALGFIDSARQDFGVRIPEDLCVIGFDDIEQASWSSYELTTFAQPIDQIVQASLLWLSEAADTQNVKSQTFNAPLVWRKTVRGNHQQVS